MGAAKKVPGRRGAAPPKEMLGLPKRFKLAFDLKGPKLGIHTQTDLAAVSGVSQPSISQLQSADSLSGVTAATVARVALALGVSSGWLLTGEGEAIPVLGSPTPDGGVRVFDEDEIPAPPLTPVQSAVEPRAARRRRAR